jgi:hypothetical protein
MVRIPTHREPTHPGEMLLKYSMPRFLIIRKERENPCGNYWNNCFEKLKQVAESIRDTILNKFR